MPESVFNIVIAGIDRDYDRVRRLGARVEVFIRKGAVVDDATEIEVRYHNLIVRLHIESAVAEECEQLILKGSRKVTIVNERAKIVRFDENAVHVHPKRNSLVLRRLIGAVFRRRAVDRKGVVQIDRAVDSDHRLATVDFGAVRNVLIRRNDERRFPIVRADDLGAQVRYVADAGIEFQFVFDVAGRVVARYFDVVYARFERIAVDIFVEVNRFDVCHFGVALGDESVSARIARVFFVEI